MMSISQATQRQIVLDAMRRRPNDLWPRGAGHVVLGIPGSPASQKAYHEPGGAISPSPGSFGISIWACDRQCRILAASDNIPLDQVRQRYVWANQAGTPSIETTTPYYRCLWSILAADSWELEIHPTIPADARICILVRSVGPAGGPINRLDCDGHQLVVNHRWVLSFGPASPHVYLADEETPGWWFSRSDATFCDSPTGWACARIELARCDVFRLILRNTAPCFASPLTCAAVKSALELDLPDEAFTASLNAQAANLLMGFVGKQTCPGEPTNYPLAWERDGAYAIVAMARYGQVDTAKDLAVYFAENDFFGGFGAEADAPGSAIHALVTVATIAGDAEFQNWLWPHIKRKVGIIAEMLAAAQTIRKPWVGPVVPCHAGKPDLPVICQPARDGLIVGRMDHHYPVLYINAFSYRGLRQAMHLAEILGKQDEVAHLSGMAETIRHAWLRNFDNPEFRNERTYMSAMWPTWIVGPHFEPFRQALQARWEDQHEQGRYQKRPLWTYFTLAEAHQWLFLDRPEITWHTLRYFWANQCSPGLYTYWEGKGEENTFGLWEQIRGWVNPPHVTPHYWTAAEMLLLQIDMLAYVSEVGADPILVVGAGVRPEWLDPPIRVHGLQTTVGPVDWSYENRKMEITLHGRTRYAVRTGRVFDKNTEVRVQHGSG